MKTICDISVSSVPIRSRSWSPAALFAGGGRVAWYDPSDTSTLFQDTAATVPAINSGDPVGCILDKSGHDRHALQRCQREPPNTAV